MIDPLSSHHAHTPTKEEIRLHECKSKCQVSILLDAGWPQVRRTHGEHEVFHGALAWDMSLTGTSQGEAKTLLFVARDRSTGMGRMSNG